MTENTRTEASALGSHLGSRFRNFRDRVRDRVSGAADRAVGLPGSSLSRRFTPPECCIRRSWRSFCLPSWWWACLPYRLRRSRPPRDAGGICPCDPRGDLASRRRIDISYLSRHDRLADPRVGVDLGHRPCRVRSRARHLPSRRRSRLALSDDRAHLRRAIHAHSAVGAGVVCGSSDERPADVSWQYRLLQLCHANVDGLRRCAPFILARSLSNVEAIIGQLYPATLLARLVSLEIAHSGSEDK